MQLLFFVYYTTFLSWGAVEGYIEIYFVDGDSLYKFNLKSETKIKLLTLQTFASSAFLDQSRNILYLAVNNSVESFKTDGTRLTDRTTLFTDTFEIEYFYLYFRLVIVHDYLYYTNWNQVKKVKVDTTTPTIEIVKTLKGHISHMEFHTDMNDTEWLYFLIDGVRLVKCTPDALQCVSVTTFEPNIVLMFRFYGLHSIVLYYFHVRLAVGFGILQLNDLSVEPIKHKFGQIDNFYVHGERLFYSISNQISVFDLKTEESRVLVSEQLKYLGLMYAIEIGMDSENNSQQTHNGTTQSIRSTEETDNASKQSILPNQGNNNLYRNTMEGVSKDGEEVRGLDSNENNSQQTHNGTTQSTRSTAETDNASKQSVLPTQGNNSLYRNTTEGVSKDSEEVRGLDSNDMIMSSTGAVIFILAVVASYIAYKKCCKNQKARAVQRMVPMSSIERPGD